MSRVRSLCVLLTIVLAAPGCYRWTDPAPPAPSTFGARTKQVRVVLTDWRQFVMYDARIQRDTLVGDTADVRGALTPRVAIPRAMVRSLSHREYAPERTTLLASVALLAMAVLIVQHIGGIPFSIGPF